MKIGLQDTVCTIHGAEGTDVKNLVSAAGIGSRARTFFDELALVAGQQKDLLAALDRVFCAGNLLKQRLGFINHAEREYRDATQFASPPGNQGHLYESGALKWSFCDTHFRDFS